MPTGILSSLVFVGGAFATAMFDERSLCEYFGDLDREQIKMGPVGRFSYARGKYNFSVAPERIDIQCNDPAIIPESLIRGVRTVLSVLEPAKKSIPVSGVGINCNAVFDPQEVGQEGNVFCQALMVNSISQDILGGNVESLAVGMNFRFLTKSVRYAIRIEPENSSQGKNLSVAINGHQDVAETDLLAKKLEAVDEVRDYVAAFHHRITTRRTKGA